MYKIATVIANLVEYSPGKFVPDWCEVFVKSEDENIVAAAIKAAIKRILVNSRLSSSDVHYYRSMIDMLNN